MGKKKSNSQSTRYRDKLADSLFPDPTRRGAFLSSLAAETPSHAIIWCGARPERLPFPTQSISHVPDELAAAVAREHRAGADPLHDAGAYYCADCSSVAEASIMLDAQLDRPIILDLCASPGGKSIFASRALRPKTLVANETIGKRLRQLAVNLERCHIDNAVVTSSDSSFFASEFAAAFDLVIVDAPCSGQSLPQRGVDAQNCFHPLVISRNAGRQKRILANAFRCVSPGGYVAYMTCTFSTEENEDVIRWALERFPDFTATESPRLAPYRSEFSDFPAYRFLPGQGENVGAGGFSCLLQRSTTAGIEDHETKPFRRERIRAHWTSHTFDDE
ncbi:MAG: RsmB/NOP family class I SAM-dependent RNA methyltransferase [Deltaproteobacteria bacterium]|nr:RsmB/NOP family class I SAM-dependent RNA methyltransferase [Deltaproteobacteria bacterium]